MVMTYKTVIIELVKHFLDNPDRWFTASELYEELNKGEEKIRYMKRMVNHLQEMKEYGLIETRYGFVKVDDKITPKMVYRWKYGGKC